MKKTHLLAATALVTALMIGAPAFAATDASAVTQTTKATVAKTMAAKPVRGPMHDAMMEMKEENKEEMAEIMAKREELHKIATAATFDKAAFLAKHEEIEALHAKLAKARGEAMATKLEGMTAEQRAKLPDMTQRPMMRHMMGKDAPAPKAVAPAAE